MELIPAATLTLVDEDGDKLTVRNRAGEGAEGLHLRIAQRSDEGSLAEAGFYLSEDALRQLLEWYQMTRPVTDV